MCVYNTCLSGIRFRVIEKQDKILDKKLLQGLRDVSVSEAFIIQVLRPELDPQKPMYDQT